MTCTQTANRLEQISTNEQRNKRRQARDTPIANPIANPLKKNPPRDDGVRRDDRPKIENRDQLMREGRCFTCKQKGHLSLNCPLKKQASLKEIELQEGIAEEAEETGKAQP